MKQARIVLDKRPSKDEGCPMYKSHDCVCCIDGEAFCNPKDCKKIVSLAELVCGETSDLYV